MVAGALEMRTLVPLSCGAAVHDTYGAKGNAQLLSTYGFTMLFNVEPDGSSNDVRHLLLPADDAQTCARKPLVHMRAASAPMRIGPTRYAFDALTKAVDAFRAVAFAEWQRKEGATGGAKRLQGVALEVRALRRLLVAVDAELAGYALDDERARTALRGEAAPPDGVGVRGPAGGSHGSPLPDGSWWPRRAAAAAALVLNERHTLRFYRHIVLRCLSVLRPAGGPSKGGACEEQRRSAAALLRVEVERDKTQVAEVPRGSNELDADLTALERLAGEARAAPVALAYVQVRFAALLAKPKAGPSGGKRHRAGADR